MEILSKVKMMKCNPYLFGAAGLILIPGCVGNQSGKELPDIVFILADDLGYGDISFLDPESKITTPNIDRIAQSGVAFTDAHSASAVSTPTRYGILTGRYSWRSELKSGVLNGYSGALISPDRKTMPQMLRERGYTTACIGKWHLGWKWNNIEKGNDSIDYSKPITDGPTEKGFDYFFGFSGSLDMPPYVYVENDRPTSQPDRITCGNNTQYGNPGYDGSFWREGPTGSDFIHEECTPRFFRRACKYVEEMAVQDKPYFLYLALPSPHTPILPSEEFKGKSGINTYADFILMIDEEVGRLLEVIEKTGKSKNTIVVFTSDNGTAPWADIKTLESKGHSTSYIYRGHKADVYEGGHRIPCFMQWPAKIRKPHIVEQTVCLNDFMATFAAITGSGLADNEAEDSYNLMPAILKPGYRKTIREATVHQSVNGNLAIRKGEWKLLMTPGSGGWSFPRPGKEEEGLPPVQLYNMKEDPSEKINLQAEHPETVKELTDLLKKYIEEGRSTPGKPQKNEGEFPDNLKF
ncbi:MAG: arylsulfatase [Bacteroidales bacterium]|nr:arylsulfatase [Bacteroidales bacterium]